MWKPINLFLIFSFFLFSKAYPQWVKLNPGGGGYFLSISFPTNTIGYVAEGFGGSALRKTTDAGQTWNYVGNLPFIGVGTDEDIAFISPDTGLACSDRDIFKTVDGGAHWTTVFHDTSYSFNGVAIYKLFLLDANTFFAAGLANNDTCYIYKTTNAGATWTITLMLCHSNQYASLYFTDVNTGYFGTSNHIYKTIDGGNSWIQKTNTQYGMNNLYFLSPDTGFSIGNYIYKTIDGAQTWLQTNSSAISQNLYGIAFLNDSIGYVVGGVNGPSIIYKTSDAGLNWTLDTSFSSIVLKELVITKNRQAFACGDGGYIVKLDARLRQQICMVTVDSVSGANMILWEKDHTRMANQFRVYKESTTAGLYSFLKSVPGSEFSTLTDSTSNPGQKADRYKLTFVDSNDVESPMSDFHKTIHLSVSKGVNEERNLNWDQYEGFPFSTYFILRGSNNSNLSIIDSVQNTLFSYTDLNPPVDEIFYAIGVINPNGCYPSYDFNRLSSNPDFAISNIADTKGYLTFNIYPNPTNSTINIFLPDNYISQGEVSIYNSIGEKLFFDSFIGNKKIIDINLDAGIYFLQVKDDSHSWLGKLMKE